VIVFEDDTGFSINLSLRMVHYADRASLGLCFSDISNLNLVSIYWQNLREHNGGWDRANYGFDLAYYLEETSFWILHKESLKKNAHILDSIE